MIVFDLKCGDGGHVFEAWFASTAAWEEQNARALVACPFCGDTKIEKAIMAPNLPAKGNRRETVDAKVEVATTVSPEAQQAKALLAALAAAQSAALKDSQWVGKEFDRKARAMDAGELDRSSIHGEVTPDQAQALIEDGIGVMPLLIPVVPPEKQN